MGSKDKQNTAGSSSTYEYCIIGEQIRQQMHKQNLIKDRRHHLRKHKMCFLAKEAIDWLLRMHHVQSRAEAILAMRQLEECSIFHHVLDEQAFKDQNILCRFTRDDDTYRLNSDLVAFYKGLDVYNKLKGEDIARNVYHRGHLYQDAFYGSDLVDCLLMSSPDDSLDRPTVVARCRELLEYGIIKHVTDDYHFNDDRLMYQFKVDYDKSCILADALLPQKAHSVADDIPRQIPEAHAGRSSPLEPAEDSLKTSSEGVEESADNTLTMAYSLHDGDDLSSGSDVDDYRSGTTRPIFSYSCTSVDPHTTPGITLKKRIIRMEADEVGYGFVLKGSAPCYVQTVDPLGPAAAAGLKVGHYVLAVNEQSVMNEDHRSVGRKVVTQTGLLTLTVVIIHR